MGTREPSTTALPVERQAHGAAFWEEVFAEAARAREQVAGGAAGVTRRRFLELLGASAALAGVGGCFEAPGERILPYAHRPEDVLPGLPALYATSFERAGYGTGVLVETHEGRPVKIEGNPEHPASLGASGALEQAALLDLYDPHRLREVRHGAGATSRARFVEEHAGAARAGTHVLLEPTASPGVARLVARLRERRPEVAIHADAPLHPRAARAALRRLYGRPLELLPALDRAEVVLALDADVLGRGPRYLRHARDFAERRRIQRRDGRMNRLYAAGPTPTVTSGMADHARALPAAELPGLAAALVLALAGAREGAPAAALRALLEVRAQPARQRHGAWIDAVAADLGAHRGRALVLVGDEAAPGLHVLGHVLGALLDSSGATLLAAPAALLGPGEGADDLRSLVDAMAAGAVERLYVLGGNPVYDAPGDLRFGEALARVRERIALAHGPNETTAGADWVLPRLHALESWGDARAVDGTASLVQPVIAPIFGGFAVAELLALLAGAAEPMGRESLRAAWALDDAAFDAALARGIVPDSAPTPFAPALDWRAALDALAQDAAAEGAAAELGAAAAGAGEPVELVFRPGASVDDGRFADNAWLQELPDPVTKLTWGNAAWIAPALARRLGLAAGDWIELAHGGRTLALPALPVAGQADGAVSLQLGYGRRVAGPIATGVGVDVHPLWTGAAHRPGARLRALSDRAPERLARTQHHFALLESGRSIVHHATLADYRRGEPPPRFEASLYEPVFDSAPQWGMAIDLTVCTGCSACVVACQAENNVPSVGREGVLDGRAMHWLRIDRYELGAGASPRPISQPMPCQHCEMAPCEYVCPVNATVHSRDGLNEMIYNRCIGTRFCSNNCPYKVRRFNWFEYNGERTPIERMRHNPDVTVRARGVMEKCTYCVQRIRRAGIEGGAAEPGTHPPVVTACQQACPTRAIHFGDLRDPESDVSRALRAPQHYAVLEHLGTRPRTRYLAHVHNPNERLRGAEDGS